MTKSKEEGGFARVLCGIWKARGKAAFALAAWIVLIVPLYMKNGFVMIGDAKYECYVCGFCLMACVCLGVLVAGILQEKVTWKRELSYTELFALFFGVVTLISCLFSRFKSTAFWGFDDWYIGGLFQGSLLIVFLIAHWLDRTRGVLMTSAVACVIVGALLISNRCGDDPLGVYQGMDWFEWNRRNLLATIGNINWVCCYLSVSVPILLFLAWRAKGKWRILGMISSFIGIAAIFLQGSEAGIVDVFFYLFILLWFSLGDLEDLYGFLDVAFLPFFFWSLFSVFQVDLISPNNIDLMARYYSLAWLIPMALVALLKLGLYLAAKKGKGLQHLPKVKVILHTIMLFAVGLGVLIFLLCQVSDFVWALFGRREILRIMSTWGSNRGGLWQAAFACYGRLDVTEKLFGVGPDCFAHAFEELQTTVATEGFWTNAVYANAHNEFLTMIINEGAVGLICYVGIFVAFLICMGKNTGKNRFAVLGILVIGGYLVNNLFAFQQVLSTPFVFLIMGMLDRETAQYKA